MIYLTANETNLGEQMDLFVIGERFGGGDLFFLDHAAQDQDYRQTVLQAIQGKVPIVAGGGTMSRYFEPFWRAIMPDQKFLFIGTGVCSPYGTDEAYPLDARHVDSRSAFRGPVDPLDRDARCFIPPPGLLYGIDRKEGEYVLSISHSQLVNPLVQQRLTRAVAEEMSLPVVESNHHTRDAELYEKAALVITSRLHGAVMAAGNAIPCLAISGDQKLDWFCNLVGMPKLSVKDLANAGAGKDQLRSIIESPRAKTTDAVARLERYFLWLDKNWTAEHEWSA